MMKARFCHINTNYTLNIMLVLLIYTAMIKVDSIGVAYRNGTSTSYEDNSHQIDFSIFDRNLSIKRFQEGMKVIIKHMGSGEVREFKVDPKDFNIFKHNDSFGKGFPIKIHL